MTSSTDGWAGDWLLRFDGDASAASAPPRAGRTDAPWRLVARFDVGSSSGPRTSTLWCQAPRRATEDGAPGWIGAPWRKVSRRPAADARGAGSSSGVSEDSVSEDRAWLFGEVQRRGGATLDETVRRAVWGDGAVDGDGAGPAALAGRFTLLVVRAGSGGARPTFELWTDRFGGLHAYRTDGAVGSSFHAVAARAPSPALDWAGITSFCALGFFLGARTHLEAVSIVRPAHRLVFDADGRLLAAERTWAWREGPTIHRLDDAVAAYDAALRAVLGEQVTDPLGEAVGAPRVAVPISGGLDSRSTVAVLPGSGPGSASSRLWSYSYGWSARSIETRIARRIARRRSLPFTERVLEPTTFDHLDAIAGATEGFSDLFQCRQAGIAGLLGARADVVLAAHWGDVWHDAADAREARLLDLAVAKFSKRGRGELLARLCAAPLGDEPATVVRTLLGDELARIDSCDDPSLRFKALKTEQWSFRWTLSSLRAYQLGALPRLPFYDPRLADVFLALPAALVRGRRLQIEHLKRHAPDLARIRWQQAGANLYLAPYQRALLPKRAFEKLGRLLVGHRPIERNWEVQFAGAAGRAGLDRHLLAPGLRLHEHLDPTIVRRWLDALEASLHRGRPDAALGATVSTVLTLAVALERLP